MTLMQATLADLEMRGSCIGRHIGPTQEQIEAMLTELSLASLDELVDKTVPANILSDQPLTLVEVISERAVIQYLRKIRSRNKVYTTMIGMGYYDTDMPAVIKRNVLENPAW